MQQNEHLEGNLLLPRLCEVIIDAGESHPVDESLPFLPAVPDERVGVRADVHRVRPRYDPGLLEACVRPAARRPRDLRAAAARPADDAVAVLAQVEAEARGELVRAARRDRDLPARCLHAEPRRVRARQRDLVHRLSGVLRRGQMEGEVGTLAGQDAVEDAVDGLDGASGADGGGAEEGVLGGAAADEGGQRHRDYGHHVA